MKAKHLVSATILIAVGVVAWECGGNGACKSTCGNSMIECSEQCDNGAANGPNAPCSSSCTLQNVAETSLQVTYERLLVDSNSCASFLPPSAIDLGIANAHVVLTGPTPIDEMWPISQSNQKTYTSLMPGIYQGTITLLDASGAALTKPKQSMMVDVELSNPMQMMVSFSVADYTKSFTGNFDFALHWGTATDTCTTTNIKKQTLTMTPHGSTTPVMMMTNDGEKLDGTSFMCATPTMPAYQEIKMMPWGQYDLTVTGGTGSNVVFCQKFSVLVGVGVGTSTCDLTVEAYTPGGDMGTCP
jgi:hypothetical protein